MVKIHFDPARLGDVSALTPIKGVKTGAGEQRLGHAINNQLTVVLPMLDELALFLPPNHPTIRELRGIVTRITELTRSALAAHKPSRITLADSAQECLRLFDRQCMSRGITARLNNQEPAPIVASRAAMDDTITNLIANAVQAIEPDSENKMITVGTEREDKQAVIYVRDTGMGMDEATLAKLFYEPFTSKPDGHGIGMLSVFAAVTEANGKIEVESAPGLGTTFRLRFPLAAESEAA